MFPRKTIAVFGAAFRPPNRLDKGTWPALRLQNFVTKAGETSETTRHDKAAMLIIGDEILCGNVTDTNTPWLAKLLFNQGVDLVRVEYVPDDKEDIISTVKRLRERVGPNGCVFSSGGIGPTHDDITYESLAEAFGERLEADKETVRLLTEHHEKKGSSVNDARMRMATLPTNSEILRIPGLWVPLVNLNSVYILPGIPRLFTQMIECYKDRFQGSQKATEEVTLLSNMPEGELADPLREIATAFPNVKIGSYPATESGSTYSVKVQLQSRDKDALDKAVSAVREKISVSE